jgi:histone deacetylase complex subunit SAP18
MPPHLKIYTWETCTLAELTHHIAADTSGPHILPDPAIGSRVAFRLVYPDTGVVTEDEPMAANARGRFVTRDLGSVLIGEGGRGIITGDSNGEAEGDEGDSNTEPDSRWSMRLAPGDASKTLADAKFVVGDYISCAILPPLPTGTSVTAAAARAGRGPGFNEVRSSIGGVFPPPFRRDGPGHWGEPSAAPRTDRFGRVTRKGDRDDMFGSVSGVRLPDGEWRRGERLPDASGPRSRELGRW